MGEPRTLPTAPTLLVISEREGLEKADWEGTLGRDADFGLAVPSPPGTNARMKCREERTRPFVPDGPPSRWAAELTPHLRYITALPSSTAEQPRL